MMANKICETEDSNINNNQRAMAINNNPLEENIKEENFLADMADMVEVRVQMYACRICGIRYNNMEAMKQHYTDVHPTSASVEEDSSTLKLDYPIIKEEIMDDDEEQLHQFQAPDDEHIGAADGDDVSGYVLIDDNGQQIQVVSIANSDNEQLVLQVVNPDGEESELFENNDQPVPERRKTRQQTANDANNNNQINTDEKPAPKKRGRKRKSETGETPAPKQAKPTLPIPTLLSTRPRRIVVPNIKSEFIYAGISGSVETPVITPKATTTRRKQNRQPEYTFVQETSGMLTAYQVSQDENDETTVKNPKIELLDTQELPVNDFNISNTAEDEDLLENGEENYPTEYTPTSKTAKGRQRHEISKGDEHLRRFPCPFQGCNYIAKYRSNLWDHKKTHTGEKPYVCNWPSCTMRFSQTHQLKLHLRSHTGERPYVCDWPGCNSAFSQKPGLKSHMLTHTGEKPFKCDYPGCGWTFRLKGALTDHKRAIHENAKKHICEWPGCNKRFLQQCHLKKHIMGHADIKPFSCDWPNCNYKAVTMAYVTNHRKTHTGEKNYECTFPNCNKRFVKSSHVNRHRQRCHPELFLYEDDVDAEDANNNAEDINGAVESIDQTSNNEENVNYLNGDANNNTNGNTSTNEDVENESFVNELLELKQEKIDD